MSQAFSNNNNSFNIINYVASDDEPKILAWLSPLEPWVRHRDIGAQRVDSVGDWLLEAEEFRRWREGSKDDESNNAILFCAGNPGVGKSFICSEVIDKLCDEATGDDTAVVCFYFDFASRNEQSPLNVLGSLLKQLVIALGGIPELVVQGFRKERKLIGGRGLQVSGILKMFQTIAVTKRVFICIDALDECVHRVVILESLGQILQGSPNTRLILTGRPHVRSEVERRLGGAAVFLLIEPTEDGFFRYLREKLRNDITPDVMSTALEADIMNSIPEISSETFLLASLHIDAILREPTIARRGRILKSVKDGIGLGDAYGATLERIKAQDRGKAGLAIGTLMWICYSERPLQVDELCHALAVEIGATDFDPENVPSIGALLGYCQGLITVDKEASTVRLIHFTVQEYLCTHPDLFDKPHSRIAETCLTYLNSQLVKELPPNPLPDEQSVPFLKYSSRYWGTHANHELSDHARTLAVELLSQYENHVSAVSLLSQARNQIYTGDLVSSAPFSGLHCAAFFGIVELVATLLNKNSFRINQQDCTCSTPLLWAAKNGHEGVVQLLLGWESVDPNCADNYPETPLGWAAIEGHERVVKLLLGREDVDPDRPGYQDGTPLSWASNNGHEGIVKQLLDRKDVDPNHSDDNNRTPLGYAAFNGRDGVVKLLLERESVDPNHPDENNQTPLGCAAIWGHEGVVKLLLEREDVDPNYQDNYVETPLGWAAIGGHEGVVKMLLGREDVDPDRPDDQDGTPLSWAANNGHEGIVKLLLDRKDVDPNHPDKYDSTPLGCAAVEGHDGVVKLLLERESVDPNRPDENDRTPLWWAAHKGHEAVVKLLLEPRGVDPNRRDKIGRSPLCCAAGSGHAGVVKLLLERDSVDPTAPGSDGHTPLALAVSMGHAGVVKLIQSRLSAGSTDAQRPQL